MSANPYQSPEPTDGRRRRRVRYIGVTEIALFVAILSAIALVISILT